MVRRRGSKPLAQAVVNLIKTLQIKKMNIYISVILSCDFGGQVEGRRS